MSSFNGLDSSNMNQYDLKFVSTTVCKDNEASPVAERLEPANIFVKPLQKIV